MQKLVKCRITFNAAQQRVAVDTALRRYGYVPVWIWRSTIPTAYLLVSVNDDLYSSGDLNLDVYNTIAEACLEVEQLDCVFRDAELLDVTFNGPSSITRTVNGNNTTVTQTTIINDGVGIWTYIFNTTFDSSGSVISTSNSTSYVDSHTQSNTVVTTDPETGETTQTTTTTTDGGYDNGGSTTTSTVSYDENGNVAGSSSQTQNSDGSSSSSTQTYNENGTIAYDHDEFHDTDGSSESHTTNFDENGNPVSGENEWIDPTQNQNTQTLEYDENGNPYVNGYTIDTSSNTTTGTEVIENGIDTGVLAFDGRDFTVDLIATAAVGTFDVDREQGTNPDGTWDYVFLNMSARDATTNELNGLIVSWSMFSSRSAEVLIGYGTTSFGIWNMLTERQQTIDSSHGNSGKDGAFCMAAQRYENSSLVGVPSSIVHNSGNNNNPNYTNADYRLGVPFKTSGDVPFRVILSCVSNVFSIEVHKFDFNNNTVSNDRLVGYPVNMTTFDFSNNDFSDITIEVGRWTKNGTSYVETPINVISLVVEKAAQNP